MHRAVSIHIGVNQPEHRGPGQAVLLHSEDAAWRMAVLAGQAGYESLQVLRGRAATRFALHTALAGAAGTLQDGDNLLVTFSGHGGWVRDVGDPEPVDQSWCLFDGQVSDDKLAGYWRVFDPGVRIVVVSDSCYSEGIYRTAWEECMAEIPLTAVPPRLRDGGSSSGERLRDGSGVLDENPPGRLRDGGGAFRDDDAGLRLRDGSSAFPANDAWERLRDGSGLYVDPGDAPRPRDGGASPVDGMPAGGGRAEGRVSCITGAADDASAIRASVLLLAAAADNQPARDGLFTCELLRVWNGGAFNGSYCELHAEVKQRVMNENPGQEPKIRIMGAATPEFALETAFHLRHEREVFKSIRYRGGEEVRMR